MTKPTCETDHNGGVTSTSVSRPLGASVVNRPSTVAVGVIVWLGSEVMFFAGLFAIYFTLRATSPQVWATQSTHLDVPYALVNTLILVSSSFTAQFGVFAAERLQKTRTSWKPKDWGMVEWFFLTYSLGAVFVTGQVFEYANMITDHVTLQSSSYGSVFFLTTGFHAVHVTGGLIAMLLIIGRAYSVKKFTHREAASTIVVSYYWHFVDVVWIALFLVIYILK